MTLTPQDQAQNEQGVVRAAKEKLSKNHPRNQEDMAMAGRQLEVVDRVVGEDGYKQNKTLNNV